MAGPTRGGAAGLKSTLCESVNHCFGSHVSSESFGGSGPLGVAVPRWGLCPLISLASLGDTGRRGAQGDGETRWGGGGLRGGHTT